MATHPAASSIVMHNRKVRCDQLDGADVNLALTQLYGPGVYLDNWDTLGPRVESRKMHLEFYPAFNSAPAYWVARIYDEDNGLVEVEAQTVTLAIARCIAADCFGEFVHLPELEAA